ncbi:MAG: GNAT family N-acetyltransferase [Chloroflexi bacterium]|jgi:ribosomal protein S18 acetylase RimI-like enzyme|nr:GNAT family N-acetyltransferase [Chloroflexota bacterium]
MTRKMSSEEMFETTEAYYSHFCGMNISTTKPGIHFVPTSQRDLELKGYGCKITIFVLVKDDLCIVSFSPKHQHLINDLIDNDTYGVIAQMIKTFKLKKNQLMIFHREVIHQFGEARILNLGDFSLFETFFRANNPMADPESWLFEYFSEKVSKEYFAGYCINSKLVSVSDAPDMPYLESKIQHTGISTLKEERRKGFGKRTVGLATHHLIELGICPQWQCDADNIASIALARSIGYQDYGIAYFLEEPV